MAQRSNYNYVKLSKLTKIAMSNILDPHACGEFKRMMYMAELHEKTYKVKKYRDPKKDVSAPKEDTESTTE